MIFLQNLSYRNRKIDASLNTHFFKISVVAHSIIYNTLMKKKACLHISMTLEFIFRIMNADLFLLIYSFLLYLELNKKSKTKQNTYSP